MIPLDRALTNKGVAHGFEIYDGDHLNRIESRFDQNVLPFFARNLRFGAQGDSARRAPDRDRQRNPATRSDGASEQRARADEAIRTPR